MKNVLVSFLFMIGFACASAQEQRFSTGLKVGLSSSQVSGDNLAGYHKAGMSAGIFCSAHFSKKWSSQFELLFIQKGSKYTGNPDAGDLNYYRLQLNYIEVPVLVQYHYKKFTVEAGPGFGYLINYKEEDMLGDITGIRPFHKSEISYNLGVNYRIVNHLGINARFSNSLSSIRDHLSGARTFINPGQQNTVLQLTLSYTFGNAKPA
jgi:outer membrane immunogenic protein